MTTLRIGSAVDFKTGPSLGGWRSGGTLTAFVGKSIEVSDGRALHVCKPSHVRPSKEETRPDRGAQQAAARAQQRIAAAGGLRGIQEATAGAQQRAHVAVASGARLTEAEALIRDDTRGTRLVMAPPPMETEEVEEVIPRDVEPMAAFVRERHAAIRPQPKAPKPTRSLSYKKFVVMQRCAITGEMAEVAHHYENAGRGRKCSDYMIVPLTNEAHRGWHDASDGWMSHAGESARARGESYDLLATKLAMAEAGWRALVAYLEQTKEDEET
jgi:hypothetical protein